eukprot:Opistho-2@92774
MAGNGTNCRQTTPCDGDVNPCGLFSKCSSPPNDNTTFTCECDALYISDSGTAVKDCRLATFCDLNRAYCGAFSSCVSTDALSGTCPCIGASYLPNADQRSCRVKTDCDDQPCFPEGIATCNVSSTNISISTCSCRDGYVADQVARFCKEKDICDAQPCGQNEVCVKTGTRTRTCDCEPKYYRPSGSNVCVVNDTCVTKSFSCGNNTDCSFDKATLTAKCVCRTGFRKSTAIDCEAIATDTSGSGGGGSGGSGGSDESGTDTSNGNTGTASSSGSGGTSMAPIIGGAVGGMAVVALVSFFVYKKI